MEVSQNDFDKLAKLYKVILNKNIKFKYKDLDEYSITLKKLSTKLIRTKSDTYCKCLISKKQQNLNELFNLFFPYFYKLSMNKFNLKIWKENFVEFCFYKLPIEYIKTLQSIEVFFKMDNNIEAFYNEYLSKITINK